MSLDVYLSGPAVEERCACECGHEHTKMVSESFYNANITHNLGAMAKEAGIYQHCWRPEEIDVTTARQLIEPLRAGLALMESDPNRFKKFDAPNGWASTSISCRGSGGISPHARTILTPPFTHHDREDASMTNPRGRGARFAKVRRKPEDRA